MKQYASFVNYMTNFDSELKKNYENNNMEYLKKECNLIYSVFQNYYKKYKSIITYFLQQFEKPQIFL